MKTLFAMALATAFAATGSFATSAVAQPTPATAAANATTSAMTEGEVRKIDKDSKKVTLKH